MFAPPKRIQEFRQQAWTRDPRLPKEGVGASTLHQQRQRNTTKGREASKRVIIRYRRLKRDKKRDGRRGRGDAELSESGNSEEFDSEPEEEDNIRRQIQEKFKEVCEQDRKNVEDYYMDLMWEAAENGDALFEISKEIVLEAPLRRNGDVYPVFRHQMEDFSVMEKEFCPSVLEILSEHFRWPEKQEKKLPFAVFLFDEDTRFMDEEEETESDREKPKLKEETESESEYSDASVGTFISLRARNRLELRDRKPPRKKFMPWLNQKRIEEQLVEGRCYFTIPDVLGGGGEQRGKPPVWKQWTVCRDSYKKARTTNWSGKKYREEMALLEEKEKEDKSKIMMNMKPAADQWKKGKCTFQMPEILGGEDKGKEPFWNKNTDQFMHMMCEKYPLVPLVDKKKGEQLTPWEYRGKIEDLKAQREYVRVQRENVRQTGNLFLLIRVGLCKNIVLPQPKVEEVPADAAPAEEEAPLEPPKNPDGSIDWDAYRHLQNERQKKGMGKKPAPAMGKNRPKRANMGPPKKQWFYLEVKPGKYLPSWRGGSLELKEGESDITFKQKTELHADPDNVRGITFQLWKSADPLADQIQGQGTITMDELLACKTGMIKTKVVLGEYPGTEYKKTLEVELGYKAFFESRLPWNEGHKCYKSTTKEGNMNFDYKNKGKKKKGH